MLVSCSINKEEANVFVENFVNAIDNANASKIKQCLETDEQKIIKIFKVSDVNKNIASNPTEYAYYYIAKGNFVTDEKEKAYDYYTKAIKASNDMYKKQNVDLEVMLLKERAKCSFSMKKEKLKKRKKQ